MTCYGFIENSNNSIRNNSILYDLDPASLKESALNYLQLFKSNAPTAAATTKTKRDLFFFIIIALSLLLIKVSFMMVFFISALLLTLSYIVHRMINARGEWPNVTGTPYRFPFGDLISMQTSRNGHFLLNLCKRLGSPQVYRIWFGVTPTLMLAHPQAVREFWKQHDETSVNRVVQLGWSLLMIMGEGIGFKPYLVRNRISRFFHRCFGPKQVLQFGSSYEYHIDIFIKRLRSQLWDPNGTVLDIINDVKYLSHDAALNMFLGPKSYAHFSTCREIVDNILVAMTKTFDARYINVPGLRWLLPATYQLRREITAMRQKWRTLLNILIKDYLADGNIALKNDDDSILLHYLRMQVANQHMEITFEELFDTVIEGLFAPTDGTAATFTNTLILLALNPEIQDETRERIKQALVPENNHTLTLDDVENCDFLDHILYECQRLLPLFMFNVPELTSCAMVLGGVSVPKGTMVMYDVQTLNRCEDIWPDPLAFIPDRFVALNEKQRKALHGFGNGRSRRCLGENLVRVLHRIFIAKMLLAFRVEPAGSTYNIDGFRRERRPFIYVPHFPLKFIPLDH